MNKYRCTFQFGGSLCQYPVEVVAMDITQAIAIAEKSARQAHSRKKSLFDSKTVLITELLVQLIG